MDVLDEKLYVDRVFGGLIGAGGSVKGAGGSVIGAEGNVIGVAGRVIGAGNVIGLVRLISLADPG